MPKIQREAIVIILDVGKSVSQQCHPSGPTFLEMSKSCILRILQRKLFAQSKDEIGLVLLGSNETANSLDYDNISEAFSLSLPTWEMIGLVEDTVKGSNVEADWLDAVVIGMQLLKDQTEGKEFSEKKIVLFTNCTNGVCEDNVEVIVKGIKSLEMELTVIGPDIIPDESISDEENGFKHDQPHNKLKSEEQEKGEAIMIRIVEETGGVICNFDDAIPQLMFYQKKTVRPNPWNVCVDIGPDIKIPMAGFKKIADVTLPSWKVVSNTEESSLIEKDRSYFKKDKSTIEKDDIIEGYSFGSTLVPFNVYDRTMTYQSGERCLSVLGFTSSSNIPRHLLVGTGVYYFFPQRDKPETQKAFSALSLALESLAMVAVVRRVYNRGNAPVLGILIPKIKIKHQCLVFVELPYSEDLHEYIFPPLVSENNKPTEEQLKSVDSLIESMDLMNTQQDDSEPTEAFHIKRTLIPYHQHFYQSLAHRALHPDDELQPISNEIMQLLKSPFENKDGYMEALKTIKKKFELIEVKPKVPKKRGGDKQDAAVDAVPSVSTDQDYSNMNVSDVTNPTVVEVGTVKPEHDFQTLLEKGKSFKEVCSQMQAAILTLVMNSFGSNNFPKAHSALKTLRMSCLDKQPDIYNDWLPVFKFNLLDRGKDAFWDLVSSNKLGLITSQETPNSTVSEESASVLLAVKETSEEIVDDIMDADDLLNEM